MADEVIKKPEIGEASAAHLGQDVTQGYLKKISQPSDPILKSRGKGLEIYEEVLRDPQVHATFQQRRHAVVSKNIEVVAGGEDAASQKAADLIREQVAGLDFDAATNRMLYGLWYGYAVAECLWAKDGNTYGLDSIKVRQQKRFRFSNDGGLRLLTKESGAEGIEMPEHKFWQFSAGASHDDEAYGRGLGYWCYWPVWFKKNGIKFWATYLDKFGGPTKVGKFPQSATQKERDTLLEAVAAAHTDSALIIPDSMAIDLLEAAQRSSASYETFYDRMDAAISKIILSQTMTTDDGSSLSQSQTHMSVRQEIVKADADLVCSSFNAGPVRWLTAWNFPTATPPKVWRKIEPPADLKSLAERDQKIYAMGFKPTLDYIKSVFGDGWEEAATESAGVGAGPDTASFAELGDEETGDSIAAATSLPGSQAQVLLEPVVGPFQSAIDDGADFEDARSRIMAAIDDADVSSFTEMLARSTFMARLAGLTEAPIDDEAGSGAATTGTQND